MKCPKCQTDNPSDSKYCKECATPFPSSWDVDISRTKTLEIPREELTVGSIFAGRYQIIEELGHGGMGRIYRAVDKKLNEEVALKLIRPEIASEKSTLERFHNELKLARKISHPNVGRMYELLEGKGIHFITMEYVPGEDLKSSIRRFGQLPISKSISIAKQICEGLAEAHKIGVVHRDLKPSNIMVDKEGNAKVMDFGIARSLKAKGITGEGVSVGTPEYMSPEQVEGKEADQRADIYSLGIILYEMVTGRVPFEGDTAFAVALKHKSEQPENPKKLNPQISDQLSRLILKCLEKNRNDRYQSASEAFSELTGMEQGLPTTGKIVPKRKPLTSRKITAKFSLRRLIIPATVLAAIAMVIILFVFFINKQPLKQPPLPSHKQLTFTGDALWPAISPDGKFIAYVTGEDAEGQKAWVQDMTSGRSIEVFNAKSMGFLRWTPNGTDISVPSDRGDFLVPRLGGQPRPIEGFSYLSAWSPDGSQFATKGSSPDKIEIINISTGKSSTITLTGPTEFFKDIDWSPADERLLICTQNKEKYAIWILKTDGSQQYKVAEDSMPILSPRWSSKGDAILYLRGQSRFLATELWKIPISRDTGKATKFSSVVFSGIQMGPYFSLTSDNRYLLYTREFEFSNLWLAKMEGSEKSRIVRTTQITSGTLLNSEPRISPDGKLVAFSRGSGETRNIYLMPIEGGNPTQITFFNSDNRNPVWSPDSEEIAFASNEGGKYAVWKVSAQGGRPYQFAKTELARSRSIHIVWAPGPNIMYLKSGPREDLWPGSFTILNPKTEEETPLVKSEPFMMMFSPCYSPDGKRVAVYWNRGTTRGLWVISVEDSSKKFIGPQNQRLLPISWSTDGNWVYAYELKVDKIYPYEEAFGEREYFRIEVESGKVKPLLTMPFTMEGKIYYKLIDDKPEIFVDRKTNSDVWVVENFDPKVK